LNFFAIAKKILNLPETVAKVANGCFSHVIHCSITTKVAPLPKTSQSLVGQALLPVWFVCEGIVATTRRTLSVGVANSGTRVPVPTACHIQGQGKTTVLILL
jgi:hypothetical protein